jgi:hypothetical protein
LTRPKRFSWPNVWLEWQSCHLHSSFWVVRWAQKKPNPPFDPLNSTVTRLGSRPLFCLQKGSHYFYVFIWKKCECFWHLGCAHLLQRSLTRLNVSRFLHSVCHMRLSVPGPELLLPDFFQTFLGHTVVWPKNSKNIRPRQILWKTAFYGPFKHFSATLKKIIFGLQFLGPWNVLGSFLSYLTEKIQPFGNSDQCLCETSGLISSSKIKKKGAYPQSLSNYFTVNIKTWKK